MTTTVNLHLIRRVLEKIFSIGTSCILHQAAVILEGASVLYTERADMNTPWIKIIDFTFDIQMSTTSTVDTRMHHTLSQVRPPCLLLDPLFAT